MSENTKRLKREYYQRHKERLLGIANARHRANREDARIKRAANPEPHRNRANKWRLDNPDKAKCAQLRKNYGITLDEWKDLFVKQGLCCAICKSLFPNTKNDWHTDHCHATGKVRGILCHNCNRGLGEFKDNVANIKATIEYLQTHL